MKEQTDEMIRKEKESRKKGREGRERRGKDERRKK